MIAFAHDNIIPMPQKSNEWYTPARYIDAAREVMGSIDLDPASCKEANMVVRAEKFYTKHENGLDHEWFGKVWCNPPYGRDGDDRNMAYTAPGMSIGKLWIDKLIREYRLGNVIEAILLGKADVKQVWFEPLWEYLICFAHNRVYFNRPGGLPPERIMFGTIFVYLGANEQRFIDIFSEFGTVARRVSTPKERPVTLSLWGDA